MKYVRDLKSSLLLSNVMGPDMKTPLNDAASFDELVKTAHNNGKLSTKITEFIS